MSQDISIYQSDRLIIALGQKDADKYTSVHVIPRGQKLGYLDTHVLSGLLNNFDPTQTDGSGFIPGTSIEEKVPEFKLILDSKGPGVNITPDVLRVLREMYIRKDYSPKAI